MRAIILTAILLALLALLVQVAVAHSASPAILSCQQQGRDTVLTIDPSGNSIDAVAVYFTARRPASGVVPGETLGLVLQNTVDHQAVAYAAGLDFGRPFPTEPFTLARVVGTRPPFQFDFALPWRTEAYGAGQAVWLQVDRTCER
jgi:hypothetical protein